jgi:succinate-semialdehyde dehydrogenase/glutarate-semialdehyde dehydrogenase
LRQPHLRAGGVYDAFAEKLAAAVGRMRVGDGLADGTDLGPLIEPKAADKVAEHIEDAVAKGAAVLTGGHGHPLGGNFFEPTVVAGAHREMLVARRRPSGPSRRCSASRTRRT